MKHILAIFIFLISSISIKAQMFDFWDYAIEPEESNIVPLSRQASPAFNSERGYWFPTKGTYRMLVIFVNIIYDRTPSANPNIVNSWGWNVTNQEGINQLPPTQYFNDVFDVSNTLPRQGFFTRYMSESSFDSLVILGDFTSVEINQSRVPINPNPNMQYISFMNAVVNYINSNGGLRAIYGHNAITDYDSATCGSNRNISRTSNNRLDYVAFLVLNPTASLTGINVGSGVTSVGGITNIELSTGAFPIENWQLSGIGHMHMKHEGGLLIHEFAHSLLGGNEFHTSGGNHLRSSETNTFIYMQQGYGLFNNSFRSCNAYERWRLGWRHPSNSAHKIAANGTNSDILSQFTGTQTFYLRDFVTYGDVIRIKLPYKDSEDASNQYIWLENRQLGKNNKLDGLNYHFFPGKDCIPLGNPGIYSFIQVGKDILESDGIDNTIVFPRNEKDNLRRINAEGNFNMRYLQHDPVCLGWGNWSTFEYLTPNPISGANDQTEAIITSNQNLQLFSDFTIVGNKIKNGVLYNQLQYSGDNFDGFEPGRVMDISSNPTPINAYTHYARYYTTGSGTNLTHTYDKVDNHRDTRKKYLTGLSIKMDYAYSLPNSGDVFKVDIHWDDYDVKNNVNWAGDIVLKENLNLLSNRTIYLEQNLTPFQINRDPVSGVFAPPTRFTCEAGSVFVMNQNSKTILKDKSSLIMSRGSSLTIQDGAQIIVESGSTFSIEQGANLIIQGSGKLLVEQGGYLCVQQGANIQLQDYNSIIAMQSGAIYGANPALFSNTSCLSSITFTGNGSIPDYNQDVYIQNETISANRYIGGRNIYVGYNVTTTKPQGDVLINNNAHVIFDATGNVRFEPGFRCALGASFEVKK